jgi:hypothetical protein
LRWIHNARTDIGIALCWVPFAVAAHVLETHHSALNALVGGVFLLSFSHQPLTMALVYGDPEQFALRRRLFTWSPLVFVVTIVVALRFSTAGLAIVAGLWNAEHTLMQRYGLTRIYGRKAGDDHGPLEKAMLLSWLSLALVWVAVDSRTAGFLGRIDLGTVNHDALSILASLRPMGLVLLGPVALAASGLAVAWVQAERRRGDGANPAKHIYVASTAILFAVILVDPIAGFVAYVASHAIEYFAVVHQALGNRYLDSRSGGSLGRTVRTLRRPGFYVAYLGGILLMMALLSRLGSVTLYSAVFFGFGGLHVFYDGFIWKLRRPAVARSLSATAA